ncbi:chromosome segregation ATPase [Paucibacter oligotrophus]|uniref:Chromosome segregation ATPase n=1 Tax=Roseateles oligotrophus TaxID=1769250 RepID=A0A840LGB3_9BURK|nr:hypothetical protein [Roseateles oligotrophus]MBB4846095.1 chromosome segregation ATPase [Roseateles oligotrophus]
MQIRACFTIAGLLCAGLLSSAQAQGEGNKPASREREQLRRVQQALQAEQAKVQGLEAEKTQLLQDKARLDEQGQRLRQGSQAQLKRQQEQAQSELTRLREALAAASAERAQIEAQAVEREQHWQTQALASRAALTELKLSNTSLAALLQGRTEALNGAEQRNSELHKLALQALDRWLNKSGAEVALQQEPLLGLGRVRMEESAEQLRLRIDAQRLPLNAAAGGGAQ